MKINIRLRFSLLISALVFVCLMINCGLTVYKVYDIRQDSDLAVNSHIEKVSDAIENKNEAETFSVEKDKSVTNQYPNDIYGSANKDIKKPVKIDDEVKLSVYSKTFDVMNQGYSEIIAYQVTYSIIVSIVALGLSYWLSGYLLRPFRQLISDIESINANNLNEALSISDKDYEIAKIKKAINQTLRRLNDTLKRQRDFTSNVSHELKTPLATMKAYAQVLDEDSTKEEFLIANQVQLKNIDRMNNLINDYITYVNNDEVKFESINLKRLIEDVIEEHRELAQQKGIKFIEEVPEVNVRSNEVLLRRLIENLINNAIKYNKQNGEIFITFEKNTLTIRDTGIGIPEDKKDDIFEPLYCVDQSRSRELGGSGLGLAIVKNICNVLGYKIEVNSKVNCGTEFVIKI